MSLEHARERANSLFEMFKSRQTSLSSASRSISSVRSGARRRSAVRPWGLASPAVNCPAKGA